MQLSNEFIRLGNDHRAQFQVIGAPYGNRTRVSAVKGRCPGPLDEGRKCDGMEADTIQKHDLFRKPVSTFRDHA